MTQRIGERRMGAFLRLILLPLILLSGLLAAVPVKAWTVLPSGCNWTQTTDYSLSFPVASYAITQNMVSGTFLGSDWLSLTAPRNGWLCVTGANGQGQGASYNLYWGGVKPAATFAAPGIAPVNVDGLTHTVWTTAALQNAGLGYIVRWRVKGFSDVGQWVTPPPAWSAVEWMPPATTGINFWRAVTVSRFSGLNCGSVVVIPPGNLNSLQDWWNTVNSSSEKRYCFATGIDTQIRYVLIKPGSELVSQLDDRSGSLTIQSEVIKNRPGSLNRDVARIVANSTVNLTIKPWGTCTTPSVTVPFNTLFATDFPDQGSTSAYRNFDLTFTQCPRISITWYVHANGKWVNSAQGIVGLSGSTPNANPVIGNPRGIGIQLAHNGGVHGSGFVYVSPDQNDPNRQVYVRTPQQGTNITSGPNQGITHTIPLRARVIRTSPATSPIVPGPFNTSVIVVVQYP